MRAALKGTPVLSDDDVLVLQTIPCGPYDVLVGFDHDPSAEEIAALCPEYRR